ncbi:hypothetical protein BTR23_13910 [Alkalihalophilus pseudofirmus]|nr:hypothetical protein BTR23_13910 [Alkalihalophilus pseudofirmus]
MIIRRPLVSVLIPAYNQPLFLKYALESVLVQTYKNIEIIIGDDSTNHKVEQILFPYLMQHSNIKYFKNYKKSKGDIGIDNFNACLKAARGEYINFLNHDDLFKKEKIEKMILYFLKNEQVSLVTSHRQPINAAGKHLNMEGPYKKYSKRVAVFGKDLGDYCLKNCENIIGEPTSVLFRNKDLNEPFCFYKGNKYENLGDLASWLSLLNKGKVVYIGETLSYFRVHPQQKTNILALRIQGIIDWFNLIEQSRQDGYLACQEDYHAALKKLSVMGAKVLKTFHQNKRVELLKIIQEIHKKLGVNY